MTINPDFYEARWVAYCGIMRFSFLSQDDALDFAATGNYASAVPVILDDEVDVGRN